MSMIESKAAAVAALVSPQEATLPTGGLLQEIIAILQSLLGSFAGCGGTPKGLVAAAQRKSLVHRIIVRRHVAQQLYVDGEDAAQLTDKIVSGVWQVGAMLTETDAAAMLSETP